MPDTRDGRDKQAHDEENRQREREIAEALERADETEPPVEELDDLEAELDDLSYPATGTAVVEAVGDREVTAGDRAFAVSELLPKTDDETFEGPADVRTRVQRPAIAASMKRIVEASEMLPNATVGGSQRDAYERTLRELAAVDAADDDEGVRVVTDWIVEQIREKERLPGSRDVRRRAGKFCRTHGYEVRNDEWLGV